MHSPCLHSSLGLLKLKKKWQQLHGTYPNSNFYDPQCTPSGSNCLSFFWGQLNRPSKTVLWFERLLYYYYYYYRDSSSSRHKRCVFLSCPELFLTQITIAKTRINAQVLSLPYQALPISPFILWQGCQAWISFTNCVCLKQKRYWDARMI